MTLDDTLALVPALAGPREVVELSGGLTNLNLLVTTPNGRYVVRCQRSDAGLLGIDRDAEHANTLAAAAAGVGPAVIDYRPDLGLLVIEHVDGRTWSNADLEIPGSAARLADACRALHAGPRFQGDFDMFARQAAYVETVVREGFYLPEGYLTYADHWARLHLALTAEPELQVPCHNDLLAANILDDGVQLWLIDYEYSGNNEPSFELGNIAAECDLTPEAVTELVQGYWGGDRPEKLARTRLQAIVSEYGWCLWGAIQEGSSDLDFDFRGWCQERFDRARNGFEAADFEDLLAAVAR